MAAERDQAVTDDAVLGGRLRLRQPRRGHRVGHDAILLAAATGARPGEDAVDLGAGVGAAGLALAARVPGTIVTLVEIDPELAALAAENARRDRKSTRLNSSHVAITYPVFCLKKKKRSLTRHASLTRDGPRTPRNRGGSRC